MSKNAPGRFGRPGSSHQDRDHPGKNHQPTGHKGGALRPARRPTRAIRPIPTAAASPAAAASATATTRIPANAPEAADLTAAQHRPGALHLLPVSRLAAADPPIDAIRAWMNASQKFDYRCPPGNRQRTLRSDRILAAPAATL